MNALKFDIPNILRQEVVAHFNEIIYNQAGE